MGLVAPPEGARLALAVMPNVDSPDRSPHLTLEEYQGYVESLQRGPWFGAMQGDSFQWSPVRGGGGRFAGIPLSQYKGQDHVLLCARAAYVLMPEVEGEWIWGLHDVQATRDSEGRPAIRIRFDRRGAKRLQELTAVNIGNRLAVSIDGHVICTMVIAAALSRDMTIPGEFTEQEVKVLVQNLREGMHR